MPLTVAWFPWGEPPPEAKGERAIGEPETTTWRNLSGVIYGNRREGLKNGTCFVLSRFALEPDGKHVHRLKSNVVRRTLVVVDVETGKDGVAPPPPAIMAQRLKRLGLAGALYTSHSHVPVTNIRYRVVCPISEEIDPDCPAPVYLAEILELGAAWDRSKVTPASVFYLPSSDADRIDQHEEYVVAGTALNARWLLSRWEADKARIEAEAAVEAAAAEERRRLRAASGSNDDSLIEQIRARLPDMAQILQDHRYDRLEGSNKWRHPDSKSGGFGGSIKTFAGVQRFFSHNGNDPLHRENLPSWCDVSAIDAFDAVCVLDFGGDRQRALTKLGTQIGALKPIERKALARLIRNMIDDDASQAEIESAAFSCGEDLGLTRQEVIEVAQHVVSHPNKKTAA